MKPFAIDIDDVLADLSSGLYQSLKQRYPQMGPISSWSSYSFISDYNISQDDFLQHIIDDGLLASILPLEGAQEAMTALKRAGHHLVMITSRGYHPKAYEVTESWLSKHDIPCDDLIIVPAGMTKDQAAKPHYPKGFHLMMDDHAKNLIDMDKAGLIDNHALIDMPWNQSFDDYRMGKNRFKTAHQAAKRNIIKQPEPEFACA